MDSNANVDATCKDNCAYTRDDQTDGSMYCFAHGSYPVRCARPFIQFGPFGFLPTGTQNFNDSTSGVLTGSITSITIYLGSFGNILEFVAGIDVTYGNDIPTLHGQRTDNNKTCDPLNAGQNYGGVLGRAGSPPLSSPVFLLDFLDTAGNSLDCRFGNNDAGDAFEVPSNISETIVFFAGATTTDTNQLATLFLYQQAIA